MLRGKAVPHSKGVAFDEILDVWGRCDVLDPPGHRHRRHQLQSANSCMHQSLQPCTCNWRAAEKQCRG